MPLLKPKPNEDRDSFLARFMANQAMIKEFQDSSQRYAIAVQQWKKSHQ